MHGLWIITYFGAWISKVPLKLINTVNDKQRSREERTWNTMIYIEEMKNTIANNNAFGHLQPKPNQTKLKLVEPQMVPLGLEYRWRVIFNGLGSKLINQVSKFSILSQTLFNDFYISSEKHKGINEIETVTN